MLSRSLLRHNFTARGHDGGLSAALTAVNYVQQFLLTIRSNGDVIQSEVAYPEAIDTG